ncbi:MAG: hypothetical protein ABIW84_09250, partial [Ilumatobacteraceae bacterium]
RQCGLDRPTNHRSVTQNGAELVLDTSESAATAGREKNAEKSFRPALAVHRSIVPDQSTYTHDDAVANMTIGLRPAHLLQFGVVTMTPVAAQPSNYG